MASLYRSEIVGHFINFSKDFYLGLRFQTLVPAQKEAKESLDNQNEEGWGLIQK